MRSLIKNGNWKLENIEQWEIAMKLGGRELKKEEN